MRSVFITGANQGIGYYMARQFLDDGENVSVYDVDTEQLEVLKAQFPEQLHVIKGDLRDANSVSKAIEHTAERFGKVDYAIHNACVCPFGEFENISDNDYRNTLDVNFYGAIHLCRAVIPIMKKQKFGKVFFTSSAIGITGFSNISSYASSKGALETLAKCLGLEYQDKGISFHIMHPPLTRTQSAKPLPIPEEMKEEPEKVGRNLAVQISKNKDKFIVCSSKTLSFQTRMMYLFPVTMGRFLDKGAKKMMANKKQ